jgi:hypothetical protein
MKGFIFCGVVPIDERRRLPYNQLQGVYMKRSKFLLPLFMFILVSGACDSDSGTSGAKTTPKSNVSVPEWARGKWCSVNISDERTGVEIWIKTVEITDSQIVFLEDIAAQFTAAAVIGDTVRFDGPATETIYITKQRNSIYFSGLDYSFRMYKKAVSVPEWAQGTWGQIQYNEESRQYDKWVEMVTITETHMIDTRDTESRAYAIIATSIDGNRLYFTNGTECFTFVRIEVENEFRYHYYNTNTGNNFDVTRMPPTS